MQTTISYPIDTGELDRERLTILNSIYNPTTQEFLKKNGLKTGMKVLEVGCGTGHMACWLAQQIGSTGNVIAIDNSAEQLAIAQQTAKEFSVTNIQFKQMDIRNLDKLKDTFDLCYGRWVLEFVENPETVVKALYDLLNPQGIFTYEGVSFTYNGHFSYPHQPIVDEWFENGLKYFKTQNLDIDFGSRLFYLLKKIDCKNIVVATNQPILTTATEKSVLRLGSSATRHTVLSRYSDIHFNEFMQQLTALQHTEVIIGFFRNILLKGEK